MPAAFTDDDVRRIAKLAALEIADADVARFAGQIRRILEYAEIVQQVDTSDVAPTAHVGGAPAMAAWREDTPAPSLERSDAVAGAPQTDRDASLFRVPKVL
jgi:aspartyl-tRNA(Asn)/glutamyl-tRNA(Gln) amidotransferase subunit C